MKEHKNRLVYSLVGALIVLLGTFCWHLTNGSSGSDYAPAGATVQGADVEELQGSLPDDLGQHLQEDGASGVLAREQIEPMSGDAQDLKQPEEPFDVEYGSYRSEYFDSLPLAEVKRIRSALRKLQGREASGVLSELVDSGYFVTEEEYAASNLESADDIYVPYYSDEKVKYYRADRSQFPRIYQMRDNALIVQGSGPYLEYLEVRRTKLVDSILANPAISNVETTTSPDNTYFSVYGVMGGNRILVGQVCAPASR